MRLVLNVCFILYVFIVLLFCGVINDDDDRAALSLGGELNHWYLRRAVAVHPAQQLAAEQRSLDALDFKRFMLNA